ncbi:MAG: hypothetical protein GTO40_05790, partial [Deltaproteobacteria bacterium]|nr:hypothetical protein [Deltaproteobacteria bacterium]
TFATHWARLADITPILLFQLLFLWIYCRRIVGIGTLLTCFLCVVLGIGVYVCAQFPHAWNGSLRYLPAFAVLLLVGIYHSVQRKVGRNLLLWASAVLALALFFRTIDNSICSSFTRGNSFSLASIEFRGALPFDSGDRCERGAGEGLRVS